jgi:cell filamentation protein, protein adenylyltransferase
MPFDPDKPYNDLPLLPPKVELESKAVLRKAIGANKALAELRGELIPNHGVLIHAVGLQEAKLSSEIENVVTTNDRLYKVLSRVHVFAKQTYRENTSKKSGFLNMLQRRVQAVDMFFGGI